MPLSFTAAVRRASRPTWPPLLGLGCLLVAIASIPGMIAYETWADMRALHAAWTIVGPPCPRGPIEPAAALVGHRSPKAISFGGGRFERWSGAVNCQGMRDGAETYAVCQFNAPGAVRVSAAGRTALFVIGTGRRATASLRDGRARCVLAGWWNPYAPD